MALKGWPPNIVRGRARTVSDAQVAQVIEHIPKKIHDKIIDLAPERSELSPRELAITYG